jgi:L-asparaginase
MQPSDKSPVAKRNHVQIFACGGTIDKVYFDARSDYQVGEPQVLSIFQDASVGFSYSISSLLRKDSLEMSDQDRQLIRQTVQQCSSQLVLITHGTDRMAETSLALLGIPDKVIVLTGSMSPARFQKSDAEFNIGFAMGALMCSSPGVYLAMNGQLFPAGHVRKNRDAGRFESTDES